MIRFHYNSSKNLLYLYSLLKIVILIYEILIIVFFLYHCLLFFILCGRIYLTIYIHIYTRERYPLSLFFSHGHITSIYYRRSCDNEKKYMYTELFNSINKQIIEDKKRYHLLCLFCNENLNCW